MLSIISADLRPNHLPQLQKWFEAEWKKPFIFDEGVPDPLIALSDDVLVGGLAFTTYPHPERDEIALWINALYVEHNNRGFGIASKLINAAEKVAVRAELFVFTYVPELYQKLDWVIVKAENENVVLKKEF
jgi:GNAT superfamily N-acetyltransferase